jgi:hypothetical protein
MTPQQQTKKVFDKKKLGSITNRVKGYSSRPNKSSFAQATERPII